MSRVNWPTLRSPSTCTFLYTAADFGPEPRERSAATPAPCSRLRYRGDLLLVVVHLHCGATIAALYNFRGGGNWNFDSIAIPSRAATTAPTIATPSPTPSLMPGIISRLPGTAPPATVPGRRPGPTRQGSAPLSHALTPHKYQLSTTVPVSRMPMPPVSGQSTANHQAQRWMLSAVALHQPMVQRQNKARAPPPCRDRRSAPAHAQPPKRLMASMVAPCMANRQRRAIQEHDREHVEWVIEQIAVAERECRGPIQVREDAERHRLTPAAHQHRAG